MKSDIRKYISLRDSLIQERTILQNRLQEINAALGDASSPTQNLAPASSAPSANIAPRGRGRRSSGLSLRDAVLQVTSRGPLSKEEILSGVKELGYRFATNNPMNSLGVILYGKKPKFKNESGRFSPVGGGTTNGSAQDPAKRGSKRRKMSPEARERIAAAQRARWAKTKAGG